MAGPSVVNASTPLNNQEQAVNYLMPLVILTSLFFMWGFITCLNDILIPHLKSAFALSYTQAMLIQFCFFGAYFLISIPAGKLVKKIGFRQGIVVGLGIAGIGCVLFYPAAVLGFYPIFLFALFVLASGITILQVSANPYVSILGPSETAPSRLTMTQAFNSLGTTVAPFFGAWLIFSGHDSSQMADAQAVQLPYLLLATALFVLAIVFSRLNLPEIDQNEQASDQPQTSAWQHRHLRLGVIAIFVYVGAEVAIGSFLVSFLQQPEIGNLAATTAAHYIAYYWGGAMVGRFIGALVMQRIAGGKVLAFNAIMAVLMLMLAINLTGVIAMWAILAVGLFNSIMFPTIFSLAINQLKGLTSQGSGLLCLAIVGGAIVPVFQGLLADSLGVQLAFVLPVFCYLYIAFYGVKGSTVDQQGGS